VPNKSIESLSFEELEQELREFLLSVAGEEDFAHALQKLQARPSTPGSGPVASVPAPSELAAPRAPRAPTGYHEDINRARNVVAKLLPSKPPSIPGLDIALHNRSCHEVGGDYYDFINLPGGRMAMIIADVSGKGYSAAIVMAMLRQIFHLIVPRTASAHDTLVECNRHLVADIPRGTFVTLLYAVIDPGRREMTLVNAGHCPPIVARTRLTGARVLELRGPALGMLETNRFADEIREKTLAIEPGDCLCFYTDGVSEAKNLLGEEFGSVRLARVVHSAMSQPARSVADSILAALASFTEGTAQHDDLSLIIVRALASRVIR